MHVGETGAVVIGGDPGELAGFVGDQVQSGLHAGHAVNLPTQGRDKE